MGLFPFWIFFSLMILMALYVPLCIGKLHTLTSIYLQFSSQYLLSHKMAVVRALLVHACSLSASLVEQSVEERHIVGALGSNGYPVRFIHRAVKSRGRTYQDTNDFPERMVTFPTFKAYRTPSRESLESWMLRCVFNQLRLSGRS